MIGGARPKETRRRMCAGESFSGDATAAAGTTNMDVTLVPMDPPSPLVIALSSSAGDSVPTALVPAREHFNSVQRLGETLTSAEDPGTDC